MPLRFTCIAAPVLVAVACGSSTAPDRLIRPGDDGGLDASTDATPGSTLPDGDVDPALGGPCVDDRQCDDGIPCTYDRCDPELARCRFTVDDTQCDDGVYCNGKERCILRRGCAPGAVVTCSDNDPCTIDRCVEATRSCERAPRDVDRDGDPDDRCAGGRDCNDDDPLVSSRATEICDNRKDDDCDGQVDEADCVRAVGDTCAAPRVIDAPGLHRISTTAAVRDYPTSCTVSQPDLARDVVAAITIPPGERKDLDLWARADGVEVAVSLLTACGDTSTETACGRANVQGTRLRARDLPPGTYYALLTAPAETTIDLTVDFLSPVPAAANETCDTAAPITVDAPVVAELIDARQDVPTACGSAVGELTYRFTIAAPSDVRLFASTVRGGGVPVTGLRREACSSEADEVRCRFGGTLPLFVRNLAPGTYVATVGATAPSDVRLVVRAEPATETPDTQSCANAPEVPRNATVLLDFSANEDAVADDCANGAPDAVYALRLAEPSDVLLVGRFSALVQGSISLGGAACTKEARLACVTAQTPVRVARRNLAAGDYRVVIADPLGRNASLTTLVRPTVAPTTVTGRGQCASATVIPPEGGFFTGNTETATADHNPGCDGPTTSPNGAPDHVLRLDVATRRRVVLSTEGSSFATVLDVRRGPSCPGDPIGGACFVGFGPARSFLDLTLEPGSYWIYVDGYDGQRGEWNLDVRVVAP